MSANSLFVPDRYDILKRKAPGQIREIIHPVERALDFIDDIYVDMSASCRGRFLIVRGESGTGKSTFLHTIGMFRDGVEVVTISASESIELVLSSLSPCSSGLRVVVLEGREALTDVSNEILEKSIHVINSFVRTEEGECTLVAWPVNRDDLALKLSELAMELGAEALVGTGDPVFRFLGPEKNDFTSIAKSTIAVLNEGASVHDLGISEEQLKCFLAASNTIGGFLAQIRSELLKNQAELKSLVAKEKCRIWTVVLAGNDPESDVDGLTRGTLYAADIDRLISVTNANIVQDLKKMPEKLGIIGTYFDARILHVKMIPALSIVRSFADDKLKAKMQGQGMSINPDADVLDRLVSTTLWQSFNDSPISSRGVGGKPGTNTVSAFEKLAGIASTNDVSLNRCFGEALKAAGVISDFKLEENIGKGLTRRTDILALTKSGPVRIEMMWRKKTGRAEIANYVLTKLYNYGKAVGYLS